MFAYDAPRPAGHIPAAHAITAFPPGARHDLPVPPAVATLQRAEFLDAVAFQRAEDCHAVLFHHSSHIITALMFGVPPWATQLSIRPLALAAIDQSRYRSASAAQRKVAF